MELVVSASGLEVTPQTIRSLSQRLDLAVDRLEAVLQKVTVHIERRTETRSKSAGGMRQCFDLACRIHLSLEGNDPIELDDMDSNLVELLDRITERLGVVVSKRADDRKLASMIRKSRKPQSTATSNNWDSTASPW
ncbi:MAG: hypothetical protein MUC83_01110 [Pirellula sp.]|nr:hypothetical protein [Pirellula sp.]